MNGLDAGIGIIVFACPVACLVLGGLLLQDVWHGRRTVLAALLAFFLAAALCVAASLALVWAFSAALRGDGGLAFIAVPVFTAMLIAPVAGLFLIGLVIARRAARPPADSRPSGPSP
jgi:hypothetical protein